MSTTPPFPPSKERFAQACQRLAALVAKDQLDEARAILVQMYPEDDPSDPDAGRSGRSALCETAAQKLIGNPLQRPAAVTLLNWSLEYAAEFASWATSGGEGMARMLDVNRLRGQIERLSALAAPA